MPANRLGVHSWEQAELAAAAWMRDWGFRDAHVTRRGSDGGVDVVSQDAVAQVKYEKKPTGRPAIQRLVGAAHGSAVDLYFFSLSGYTKEATAYGTRVGVALFSFAAEGTVHAVNTTAAKALEDAQRRTAPVRGQAILDAARATARLLELEQSRFGRFVLSAARNGPTVLIVGSFLALLYALMMTIDLLLVKSGDFRWSEPLAAVGGGVFAVVAAGVWLYMLEPADEPVSSSRD